MLPSSLIGLVLFLVLLAPGFVYVLRHEKHVAGRPFSAFRETLRVVFVSVACLLLTGLIFTWMRWAWPERTLNVRGLVRDPAEFARDHHVELAWWSLAFISAATFVAAVAADRRVVAGVRWLAARRPVRWLSGSTSTQIRPTSQWARVFDLYEEDDPGPVLVGLQLDDGSYLRGRLWVFNPAFEENEDRELVLSQPLTLTPARGPERPYQSQFAIVSARHIVRMDVDHLPKGFRFDGRPVGEQEAEGLPPSGENSAEQ
ncbi:DUF6338 family protein [Micromonospora sp. NPDC049799]|uniref:DUF6338 family protein n=1 Tax=Micromonospora sp. NPDC049799 TaxID=3154741 RepID=UPI0033F1DEEE